MISNDAANRALNRVQVVPLSSKAAKLYPGEAHVTLRGRRAKAMADLLTTVSKLRLRQQIGSLGPADLAAVEQAIRVQLALL